MLGAAHIGETVVDHVAQPHQQTAGAGRLAAVHELAGKGAQQIGRVGEMSGHGRREIRQFLGVIGKRIVDRGLINRKVERSMWRVVEPDVALEPQAAGFLGKADERDAIAKGIVDPADLLVGWFDNEADVQ